ncbi:G-protein coupled receptor Mth2-like isoform X4 [Zophobas morio]|uniref:G-protein coupled receptor Mth2-like isoform X4 n=1 Tax=Zophobas morio TaxID=2755281 RepID=UPI0030833577
MFLLYFFVLLFSTVNSLKTPCPKVLALDITTGNRYGSLIVKDDLTFNENNYFAENGTIYGCICNIRNCIRKCCGPNEIMVNKTCTPDDTTLNYKIHSGTVEINSTVKHHFIHNMDCDYYRILLRPHHSSTDSFYIQENGSIHLPNFLKRKMRNPEHFCVETFEYDMFEMRRMTSAIICIDPDDIEEEDTAAKVVHLYGMIISMPFLLLTFIAYALLPDRNLHMKALMIYVINLMLGYLLLVIIQLSEIRFSDGVCTAMGYFCVFFFLVSFFWMNVICIDIWFAFSGLRGFSGSKKTAERKRFFMYCGYAFGMPVLHVLVVRLIDSSLAQNSDFKPGIGTGQCFLKRGFPELLYFYGPMAILITINIILFTITAFKIRSVKKETSMLKKEDSKRHSYENDKQTFNLYLKLLFAMGINWSMEIISWAVIWAGRAPDAIWYLTDFCNAIYGVFIFFIFVFKRSIWKLLKKRYYSFIGKTHLAHSLTMTNTTRVTSYSVTNSSVHENPHGVANDSSTLTSYA